MTRNGREMNYRYYSFRWIGLYNWSYFILQLFSQFTVPFKASEGNVVLPTLTGGAYLIHSFSNNYVYELVCDSTSCTWNALPQNIDGWCCYHTQAVYVDEETANCP